MELNAIVIPTITYPSEESFDWFLDGLESCTVVGFSTKGYIGNEKERGILIKAIKETVDRLPYLEAIIVYDVCADNKQALEIFEYAILKGIKIIIPPNMLKDRNKALKEERKNA